LAADSSLKPGGWVEFQDWDHNVYSDDRSLKDEHNLRKWNVELLKAFAGMGREASPGPKLKTWVEDAGFRNVTHEVFKAPFGPWPKEKRFVRESSFDLMPLLQALTRLSERDWFSKSL
jgi:hypothetical protein